MFSDLIFEPGKCRFFTQQFSKKYSENLLLKLIYKVGLTFDFGHSYVPKMHFYEINSEKKKKHFSLIKWTTIHSTGHLEEPAPPHHPSLQPEPEPGGRQGGGGGRLLLAHPGLRGGAGGGGVGGGGQPQHHEVLPCRGHRPRGAPRRQQGLNMQQLFFEQYPVKCWNGCSTRLFVKHKPLNKLWRFFTCSFFRLTSNRYIVYSKTLYKGVIWLPSKVCHAIGGDKEEKCASLFANQKN